MTTLVAHPPALSADRATSARRQVLVGAVLVQLILGTVYGYSVFWQPLESELWPIILTEEQVASLQAAERSPPADAVIVADSAAAAREREARLGYLKYSFSLCLLSFAAAMLFAGRLQDVRGPRFTALLGGVILSAGFLVAGEMDHAVTLYLCHAAVIGLGVTAVLAALELAPIGPDRRRSPIVRSIPYGIMTAAIVAGIALGERYVSHDVHGRLLLLWGTIGVLAGVGIGFAYVCPIAVLVKWFPAHKGLVSGVAVAGFGLGAYVFSQKGSLGAVGFIEAHGIKTFFTVHGLLCLVVVTLGALLLRNPPVTDRAPASRIGPTAEPADATWRELLRSRRFYLIWMMFFSGAMAGLMVIGILKPFAGNQLVVAAARGGSGLTDTMRNELLLQGAAAVGVLALFNAAGRVVWGLVSDRVGRVTAMALMFALQAITLLLLGTLETKLQLTIGAACVGFNFGGNFALFPSLTADLFGAKNFGANYAWVFTSYGVAGVIGVWVGNVAQRMTGSYFAAFAAAAALCVFSAVLAVTLRPRRAATR